MSKIKMAQIGTNRTSHGRDIFECISSMPDIFEVVGYALPEDERNRFPEKLDVFEGYREMSVEEILSDKSIQAVTIETEEVNLTKYALLAAKAGKHIHIEKPGGFCHREFEELIEEVKSRKIVLHFGYMYRHNPYISKLLKRINDGELGNIISVEAQMNTPHPYEIRKWLESVPGGSMFFLGCHLIDLIVQIQGFPENIIPFNRTTGVDGLNAKDFGMAVLEYKNGVSFAKTCSVERGGFSRRQLVVTGTKGTVEVRPLEFYVEYPDIYTEYKEIFSTEWTANSEFNRTEYFDRYKAMMKHFANHIKDGITDNYDYELKLHECVLKASGMM